MEASPSKNSLAQQWTLLLETRQAKRRVCWKLFREENGRLGAKYQTTQVEHAADVLAAGRAALAVLKEDASCAREGAGARGGERG